MKTGLPPVGADHSSARLLILGSLPGERSLSARRYYAHPQNQFWRLLGEVLGDPLADLSYDERLARLSARGVMLWDVIARAERAGSLDSAIRRPAANPLAALIADTPRLELIAFNGQKAATEGRKALGPAWDDVPADVLLPSSSPAHAVPYADKLAVWWAALRPVLRG